MTSPNWHQLSTTFFGPNIQKWNPPVTFQVHVHHLGLSKNGVALKSNGWPSCFFMSGKYDSGRFICSNPRPLVK